MGREDQGPVGDAWFEQVRARLNRHPCRKIGKTDPPRRRAGVLVPLFSRGGGCWILFTRRSRKVAHHKGQISFPGGAVEACDASIEETVLREVEEEIGVRRQDAELLGRLDDALTVTSPFVVSPIVGRVPYPYAFRLAPSEVAGLLTVPLAVFHPANRAARRGHVRVACRTLSTPAFVHAGEVVWGATARIMENLVQVLDGIMDLPGDRK